jgi:hypothetical protein
LLWGFPAPKAIEAIEASEALEAIEAIEAIEAAIAFFVEKSVVRNSETLTVAKVVVSLL